MLRIVSCAVEGQSGAHRSPCCLFHKFLELAPLWANAALQGRTEKERALISERTTAALAAAKRSGRKLGTAGSVETAARARAARSEQATKANATTRAVIAEIQRAGKSTLAAIAQELEARGVRTPAGRDRWAPAQVSRLLAA
jgi:hypothetical protein